MPWAEIMERKAELRELTTGGEPRSDMNDLLDQEDDSNFVAAVAATEYIPESSAIVGWATCDIFRSKLRPSRDRTHFNVFVHPDYRHKGLGRELLHRVLHEVQDIPTPKVRVETLSLILDLSLYFGANLRMVGPAKPMGYLPKSTMHNMVKDSDRILPELSARGVRFLELSQHECWVGSGCIVAWDPEALQALLTANLPILAKNNWPTIAEPFVRHSLVHSVRQTDEPDLYRLIGLAYADKRFVQGDAS